MTDYNKLRSLAGEILSTIHVNFLRGTLVVNGNGDAFQCLIDQWEARMLEFNPKVEMDFSHIDFEKIKFN